MSEEPELVAERHCPARTPARDQVPYGLEGAEAAGPANPVNQTNVHIKPQFRI